MNEDSSRSPAAVGVSDTTTARKHNASTVFIGNLSFFCKESDLVSLFSTYGSVTNVEVARSPEGNNLLYGYVDLEGIAQAQQCAQELNGRLHKGRFLR